MTDGHRADQLDRRRPPPAYFNRYTSSRVNPDHLEAEAGEQGYHTDGTSNNQIHPRGLNRPASSRSLRSGLSELFPLPRGPRRDPSPVVLPFPRWGYNSGVCHLSDSDSDEEGSDSPGLARAGAGSRGRRLQGGHGGGQRVSTSPSPPPLYTPHEGADWIRIRNDLGDHSRVALPREPVVGLDLDGRHAPPYVSDAWDDERSSAYSGRTAHSPSSPTHSWRAGSPVGTRDRRPSLRELVCASA